MPKKNLSSDKDMSILKNEIWDCIRKEATKEAANEPILTSFLHTTILNHDGFASSL